MSAGQTSIAAFRALFEGSGQEIEAVLSDQVELRPPTYGKSWIGRELVGRLLGFASASFGGLTYTQVWGNDEDGYVLRFEGMLDGKPLSGVDIVRVDADGRIAQIEISARPPAAMLALRDRMGAHVRADPVASKLMGLPS
jgi:hypothetical protein